MTDKAAQTPSDVIGARIKEVRRRLDWTAERLAEECRRVGATDMTAAVIANIETGRRRADGRRRREVTVEELVLFAKVLSTAPVHLMVPVTESTYQLTPDGAGVRASRARGWVRGFDPISSTDRRIFFSEVPEEELRVPDWQRRALEAEIDQRGGQPVYLVDREGRLPEGVDALVVEGTGEALLGDTSDGR
jgi:transcriptional regulator with XRE-family HTH domain